MLTHFRLRDVAVFVISLCVFLLCQTQVSGLLAKYGGALAEVVSALFLIMLLTQWPWMQRVHGQTPLELMCKAGAAALVLAVSVFAVRFTTQTRGPLLDALLDFIFLYGLLGVVLLLAFAFAASRKTL